MVLGQKKVEAKSHEITAIPELLELIDIEDNIVTIDTMGTQTNIADKIIEKKGNYILSVKENQPQLLEEVEDEFRFAKPLSFNEDTDVGHGRIETRKCSVVSDFQFVDKEVTRWADLNQIV